MTQSKRARKKRTECPFTSRRRTKLEAGDVLQTNVSKMSPKHPNLGSILDSISGNIFCRIITGAPPPRLSECIESYKKNSFETVSHSQKNIPKNVSQKSVASLQFVNIYCVNLGIVLHLFRFYTGFDIVLKGEM